MPGFSKGFIFRPIQWEGLMCFIQAQYRIKGGIQGLSLENTMLFVGVIWFILLFRSAETEQGSHETQREGCCFIAKAKRTVNMFTYDNDFKTHPCKMDLFLLDLVFHVVCLTLPQTLTTYKKSISEGKKKVMIFFLPLIESGLQVSLGLSNCPEQLVSLTWWVLSMWLRAAEQLVLRSLFFLIKKYITHFHGTKLEKISEGRKKIKTVHNIIIQKYYSVATF